RNRSRRDGKTAPWFLAKACVKYDSFTPRGEYCHVPHVRRSPTRMPALFWIGVSPRDRRELIGALRRRKACFRDCHSFVSLPAFPMLRPRKKYTVFDLQQLKGKRCLTHIHVKSPEEAAAAEQAGVDLMSCSFDTPE